MDVSVQNLPSSQTGKLLGAAFISPLPVLLLGACKWANAMLWHASSIQGGIPLKAQFPVLLLEVRQNETTLKKIICHMGKSNFPPLLFLKMAEEE